MTFWKIPSSNRLDQTNKVGVTGISNRGLSFLNDCPSKMILSIGLLQSGYVRGIDIVDGQ